MSFDAPGSLTVMPNTAQFKPVIEHRDAQPYVAVKRTVTMETMMEIADRIGEVIGWLIARGGQPAGAPFLKYDVIDMERHLVVEAGVPVATEVTGDEQVFADVLPAGRYATYTHVGHPDGLVEATAALLAWARTEGLTWDMTKSPDGDRWGSRLELYHTHPAEQPDMSKWETELAFRLADG
jgi:effector-binding domain-containing protein